MEAKTQKFFLAANSCEGFISEFGKNFFVEDGWKAYLIKGGPGTGKSSFMRHFASHSIEKGLETVLCPCSSDPKSLDGVILPQNKVIILDATAPHTLEPQMPGVCEEIVNLGNFWNSEILRNNADIIQQTTKENKSLHRKAAKFLAAAGEIVADSYNTALRCSDTVRCAAFAEKVCKKMLPNKKGAGSESVRFLQGVTPFGVMSYTDSIDEFYKNTIIISDNYGAVSNAFMRTVRDIALKNGYEIITVKNAFLPSVIIDHIIIPELSLAFASERNGMQFSSLERRIHARRFTDNAKLHKVRQRLLFNKRITCELLGEAVKILGEAKAVHDKLEKYYVNAMDFTSAAVFAEEFVQKVLL